MIVQEKQYIIQEQISKYLNNGKCFIDDNIINNYLNKNPNPDKSLIKDILDKSFSIKSLSLEEASILLNVEDNDLIELMKETALKIKKKVYDNRIVTFAPLYLSTKCVNNCLYCGLRSTNKDMKRKVLSLEEVQKEVEMLCGNIGHKRLIVVYGDHDESSIDYMIDTINKIYSVKVKTRKGDGQIRRVNVNAPSLNIEDLRKLKETGIGTYQVFQETYHNDTYNLVHPKGPKSDYLWRLYSMHRAFEAGIDDVGIGSLFGLYSWKYEVMGLVSHSLELESKFNVGPHTVSFPRLEKAFNTPYIDETKYKVSDDDFKKAVLVLRLAIPYTGMIMTCRENPDIRKELINYGITQMDASTKIDIGGYSQDNDSQIENKQQFVLKDNRSLDDVVYEFAKNGFITSFCTAAYRCGRTGECIMETLKSGKEGVLCKLNAVITYKEWLDDFASFRTKEIGEIIIEKEINEIKNNIPEIYPSFMKFYERTKNGERDLFF